MADMGGCGREEARGQDDKNDKREHVTGPAPVTGRAGGERLEDLYHPDGGVLRGEQAESRPLENTPMGSGAADALQDKLTTLLESLEGLPPEGRDAKCREAITVCGQLLILRPEDFDTLIQRALLRRSVGEHADAAIDLIEAAREARHTRSPSEVAEVQDLLARTMGDAEAPNLVVSARWQLAASSYMQAGDVTNGARCFALAVRLNPSDDEARQQLRVAEMKCLERGVVPPPPDS